MALLKRNENFEIVEITKKVKPVKIPIAKKNKTIRNSPKNVSKEKSSENKAKNKENLSNNLNRNEKLVWYYSFIEGLKNQEQMKKNYEATLSEYEKIRLENIKDRVKMFNELKFLSSQLSKQKYDIKDAVWKKLCKSANKMNFLKKNSLKMI